MYGVWIPLGEDSMPEDLVNIHEFNGEMFTDEVIVPMLWGNEYGGGTLYPAYRYKKKGNETWHWSFKSNVRFPLFYMIMPKLPSTKGLSHEFVEKVMERMKREDADEKARLERRFESLTIK